MIPSTNGTDEGVLRLWLDREIEHWLRCFVQTLDESMRQLRDACFGDAWQALQAEGLSQEDAARRALDFYERGLTDIFRFVRQAGAIVDDLSWSQFKAGHRRSMRDQDASAAAIDALDNALYTAEQQAELTNHRHYRSLVRCVMLFVYQHAANGPQYPGPASEDAAKLAWAYQALKDIEDHQDFQLELASYINDSGVRPVVDAILLDPVDDIINRSAQLAGEQRFDLLLNTALLWLVGAVERN